ncbi:MAG TPA: hypothetical protein VEG28_05820 [Dehalococcoidia bacterium]|nr:hypothetical protein [Dehalococcoidia bacterium]
MTSTVIGVPTIASTSATAAAVVGLIIMLVARELLDASERPHLKLIASRLAVFAAPLLVFVLTVIIVEAVKAAP